MLLQRVAVEFGPKSCFSSGMKYPIASLALLIGFAGCASLSSHTKPAQQGESPAPAPEKVNWEEVDRSTARTKERGEKKPADVTKTDTVEQGFLKMSTDDYVSALASAMSDVRQEHPDWSQAAVETEAVRRADEAKRKYESSYSTRTSTEVKWSKTPPP